MKKKITIPRGWRPVSMGETVQLGDKVWFRSRWDKSMAHEIGHVVTTYSFLRIRKISP